MERLQGELTDGDFDPPVWISVSSVAGKRAFSQIPTFIVGGGTAVGGQHQSRRGGGREMTKDGFDFSCRGAS